MPNGPAQRPLFDGLRLALLHEGPTGARSSRAARLRVMLVAALLSMAFVMVFSTLLSHRRSVDADWSIGPQNHLELSRSDRAELQPLLGQTLISVQAPGRAKIWVDARALYLVGQWNPNDQQRRLTLTLQQALAEAMQAPMIEMGFDSGDRVSVPTRRIGIRALGLGYWLLMGLASILFSVSMAVLWTRPIRANVFYALLSGVHVVNLVLLAAVSTSDLTSPTGLLAWDQPLRLATDLMTVAAMVQIMATYPVPQTGRLWLAGLSWIVTVLITASVLFRAEPDWWLARTSVGFLGILGLALAIQAQRQFTHPLNTFFKRVGIVTWAIWILLTIGVATSAANPGPIVYLSTAGTVLWSVFLALLLLLMPFLARSRQIVREFALLAGITTAATALNLLLVSVWGLDTLTALTLTVLFALVGYIATRQWLLDKSIGRVSANVDRLFGQIYTALSAEDAHSRPPSAIAAELLSDIFAARTVQVVPRRHTRARVSRDGATLTVPVPATDEGAGALSGLESIELQAAQGGRRLFTLDDARWAERVLSQFSAALAVQRAREQGRTEERQRLAQDLHDDIGARLLTLMYKAPSRDIEDYIRNTITDLKTLTRGLASGSRHLLDAAAEWRTDAGRRLEAAQIGLNWDMAVERDIELNVVQWSSLTRVLRELFSNVIAHAQATAVRVRIEFQERTLMIVVEDDGVGGAPEQWAHGLGVGGIRKRVMQMNGEVRWTPGAHGGIRCEVRINGLSPRGAAEPA